MTSSTYSSTTSDTRPWRARSTRATTRGARSGTRTSAHASKATLRPSRTRSRQRGPHRGAASSSRRADRESGRSQHLRGAELHRCAERRRDGRRARVDRGARGRHDSALFQAGCINMLDASAVPHDASSMDESATPTSTEAATRSAGPKVAAVPMAAVTRRLTKHAARQSYADGYLVRAPHPVPAPYLSAQATRSFPP